MPTLRQRLTNALLAPFRPLIQAEATRLYLAYREQLDFTKSGGYSRAGDDLFTRQEYEHDALEAWIRNPYAHRIISITQAHIIGRQITLSCAHKDIDEFIRQWWAENNLDLLLYDLVDEILRSGELLIAFYTNQYNGKQTIRGIPGRWLHDVYTHPQDYARHQIYTIRNNTTHETFFHQDEVTNPFSRACLYYAINRPLGSVRTFGGILTPVLPAIERYNQWLHGRTDVNEAGSKYVWDITASQERLSEVEKRFANGVPSGSSYVHTPEESIKAINSNVGSWDARDDGQAFRQYVAAGANTATHMLADVTEGSRAGAQEASTPTYRIHAMLQQKIALMLVSMAINAVTRAYQTRLWHRSKNKNLPKPGEWGITAQVTDLTRQDNLILAQATDTIVNALTIATKEQYIDQRTAREWLFAFAGQYYDPDLIDQRMKNPPTKAEAIAQEESLKKLEEETPNA